MHKWVATNLQFPTNSTDALEAAVSPSSIIRLSHDGNGRGADSSPTGNDDGGGGGAPLKVLAVISLFDKEFMSNDHYKSMITAHYEKALEVELHRLQRLTTPPDVVVCIISGQIASNALLDPTVSAPAVAPFLILPY